MKLKDGIEKCLAYMIFTVLLILLLPVILIYFLFKLVMTPVDYIKYKKSRYQRDFPLRYTWLSNPHADNEPYTAIKENNLPIEYIKWRKEYDLNGYFIYKDILLVFEEPFFFDKKRGLWLIWPGDTSGEAAEEIGGEDDEDTDDCLTGYEAKKYITERFREDIPSRECNRVVLFYSRKNVEKNYGNDGLEKMRELEDFIIYEKGELADAIKKVVESYSS